AAEPWGILASDRTVCAAVNFEFGAQVEVAAKGKSAPVAAREVMGPRKGKAQRRVRLPLVGRENDLAQLQLVARRVVNDRRPSMVSVIAPAGTGKTRLVEEFLEWLPSLAAEAIVATAQCLPYGQQLTYWPMRQVLFTLTGTNDDTPPGKVRDAIWIWLKRIGVEDPDRDARLLAATIGEAGTEGVDKDLLFAAWRSALEATARLNPLVIIFEDLHWSSDSLLDLAEFVMQPRGDAAVLMIVLARPELLDRRPNWGGGRLNHLAIALEPGLDQHVLELCENLADRDLIRPAEGDRYSFRHILIQEVAYGTLPRSERARLHAEAARWVESNAGQREVALAEILAFHYREAAVLYTALEPGSELTALIRDKAAQWLLRATDVAVAAGATPEAVRHLRATFDLVHPAPRPR